MRSALTFVLLSLLSVSCSTPVDEDGKPLTVGRVRLRTFPTGAQVWINGELKVESTPATLILEQGTYELKIQVEGAAAMTRTLEVDAGDNRELDLNIPKPPDATLTVLSDVEGARVRVNGFSRGYTPMLRARTKPGPIDITVEDGLSRRAKSKRAYLGIGEQKVVEIFFEPASSTLPKKEKKKELLMTPVPAMGSLTLGTQPNSEVFTREGKSLGKTPLEHKELSPGTHKLTLRSLDGRYEKEVEIEIEAKKHAIYRFRFQPEDQR